MPIINPRTKIEIPKSPSLDLSRVCCQQKRLILQRNLKDNKGLFDKPTIVHVASSNRIPLREKQRFAPQIKSKLIREWIISQKVPEAAAIVDFAHPSKLGGGVFGGGYAQEEILMMQLSALGEIPEINKALRRKGIRLDQTPILIQTFQTHRFTDQGRRLYGNSQLGSRGPNTIDRAPITGRNLSIYFQKLSRPRPINIIAMAAPDMKGKAYYSKEDLKQALNTAYRAFQLAESHGIKQIHTGPWGAGVFGNSENVTAVLQILAAQYAGVQLYYHCIKCDAYNSAIRFLKGSYIRGETYSEVINSLVDYMQYKHKHNKFWRPKSGGNGQSGQRRLSRFR